MEEAASFCVWLWEVVGEVGEVGEVAWASVVVIGMGGVAVGLGVVKVAWALFAFLDHFVCIWAA